MTDKPETADTPETPPKKKPRPRTNYGTAAGRRDVGTPKPGATAIRTEPYRTTVDLEPLERDELTKMRANLSAQLGMDVPMAEVFRVLGRLARYDRKLLDRVRQQIPQGGGKLTGELDKKVDKQVVAQQLADALAAAAPPEAQEAQ
jgi:hypothetical protein